MKIKPSLGSPARGTAFFPRQREINEILTILEADSHIYLSAPRRVGKSSILHYLEDSNQENSGYYFVYVTTESVSSINDYFKVLYTEVLESEAIKKLAKYSQKLQSIVKAIAINIEVSGIKAKDIGEEDYYNKFIEVIASIDRNLGKIVVMVDEFPQTIQNILKVKGGDEARKFIQLNRELRQKYLLKCDISFIYTGSIAMMPIVEKISSLNDVNDIISIEVGPLSEEDALALVQGLLSVVDVDSSTILYLLEEVKWLIPFHLQLIAHELKQIHSERQSEILCADIDLAIERTVERKNKAMFEPYFARLKKLLEANQYQFAMDILCSTAKTGTIEASLIFDRSLKHDIQNFDEIVDMLCEDGYIYKSDGYYIFTSPILQLWILKNNNYGF